MVVSERSQYLGVVLENSTDRDSTNGTQLCDKNLAGFLASK